MTKTEHDLLIAIGQALFTLLYQMRAVERQDTQDALLVALKGVRAEPLEGR